jgi:hypothetical protein
MKIFKKLCSFFHKDSVSTQKTEIIEELLPHFMPSFLYMLEHHEKIKGSGGKRSRKIMNNTKVIADSFSIQLFSIVAHLHKKEKKCP